MTTQAANNLNNNNLDLSYIHHQTMSKDSTTIHFDEPLKLNPDIKIPHTMQHFNDDTQITMQHFNDDTQMVTF
jgi:hypothetical protein